MTTESLGARLARAGMPMTGDTLTRAHDLLRAHGSDPERLTDLQLMTICVAAYRRPDSDLPHWV